MRNDDWWPFNDARNDPKRSLGVKEVTKDVRSDSEGAAVKSEGLPITLEL